jgi:hypothetical protein
MSVAIAAAPHLAVQYPVDRMRYQIRYERS